MKVYSGRQFGNSFNSGDEGLFQDANRPRDDDKFKIRPGVQTQKNDLRTANSGIAAQATFYGVKKAVGGVILDYQTANMKNKYSASDISEIDGFTTADGTKYKASEVAKGLDAVILGNPYANANGDIVIGKGGVYAVTCQCAFYAPYGYDVSTTANWKFYVALMLNGQKSLYTQGRGCGSVDTYSVFYVGWFDEGDRINTGFFFTYPFTYKGATDRFESLPYPAYAEQGDAYYVLQAHTTAPVFPAKTVVAFKINSFKPLGDPVFEADAFVCQPSINVYRLS